MTVETILFSPKTLKKEILLEHDDYNFVEDSRETLRNLVIRKDKRQLIIVGPCSIHDYDATMEYARKLQKLALRVSDRYFIVMRTYIEKARTSIGWKGYAYDPFLKGSADLVLGLQESRRLLRDITQLGVAVAMEIVDPLIYHYFDDLVSWACIGARTSNSQLHRQFASSLDFPVGFKNTLSGEIDVPLDAILSSRGNHGILSLNEDGRVIAETTKGNPYTHLVLRGSRHRPNYHLNDVLNVISMQKDRNINVPILIDCSHGNSNYSVDQLISICKEVKNYSVVHHQKVLGFMLESFLEKGNQPFKKDSYHQPNLSITDPCISWDETVDLLLY